MILANLRFRVLWRTATVLKGTIQPRRGDITGSAGVISIYEEEPGRRSAERASSRAVAHCVVDV